MIDVCNPDPDYCEDEYRLLDFFPLEMSTSWGGKCRRKMYWVGNEGMGCLDTNSISPSGFASRKERESNLSNIFLHKTFLYKSKHVRMYACVLSFAESERLFEPSVKRGTASFVCKVHATRHRRPTPSWMHVWYKLLEIIHWNACFLIVRWGSIGIMNIPVVLCICGFVWILYTHTYTRVCVCLVVYN